MAALIRNSNGDSPLQKCTEKRSEPSRFALWRFRLFLLSVHITWTLSKQSVILHSSIGELQISLSIQLVLFISIGQHPKSVGVQTAFKRTVGTTHWRAEVANTNMRDYHCRFFSADISVSVLQCRPFSANASAGVFNASVLQSVFSMPSVGCSPKPPVPRSV